MAKTKIVSKVPVKSVNFPRDLWQKLCVIAAHSDLSKHEAIERFCGPAIDKQYRKIMNQNVRELGEAGA